MDGHLLGRAIRYAIERKFAEVQLSHQALHDPLTGLANRALLMERLAQAIARTERRPSSVAVLFLDIDRFKTINATSAMRSRDSVLACIGDRLRRALRPEDMASRFGGDEFVVLCEDLDDDARGHDRQPHREVDPNQSLWRRGRSWSRRASGSPRQGDPRSTPGALRGMPTRRARARAHRVKERGRDRFEFFDQRMLGAAQALEEGERASGTPSTQASSACITSRSRSWTTFGSRVEALVRSGAPAAWPPAPA